jgi:hypothetical protein
MQNLKLIVLFQLGLVETVSLHKQRLEIVKLLQR